jgi:hypothetical protein
MSPRLQRPTRSQHLRVVINPIKTFSHTHPPAHLNTLIPGHGQELDTAHGQELDAASRAGAGSRVASKSWMPGRSKMSGRRTSPPCFTTTSRPYRSLQTLPPRPDLTVTFRPYLPPHPGPPTTSRPCRCLQTLLLPPGPATCREPAPSLMAHALMAHGEMIHGAWGSGGTEVRVTGGSWILGHRQELWISGHEQERDGGQELTTHLAIKINQILCNSIEALVKTLYARLLHHTTDATDSCLCHQSLGTFAFVSLPATNKLW